MSKISSKCSLSYTEPHGFDGLLTTMATVSSSIWLSKSSRSIFQCSSGCKVIDANEILIKHKQTVQDLLGECGANMQIIYPQ